MTTATKESPRKQKRQTQAERAAEGNITPRLLTEQEAAIYLGTRVSTLQNIRGATPKRWTQETFDAAIKKGGIVPPPYVELGSKKMYDLRRLDRYIDLLPVMGQLPEDEAP